ncbi:mitochondrial fusion protein [Aspergillus luchuensis]|uniref:Mitochondrial fusion protein n=1 Tax=Aspergillus kawachii TaxID=1069201 RepID=A0A146FIL0_ASPKA|nr:mitochondrial fusion protein [Aspergillus luchuensis]
MLQGQLPDEPELSHENKSNPSVSGEMIGQSWSSKSPEGGSRHTTDDENSSAILGDLKPQRVYRRASSH